MREIKFRAWNGYTMSSNSKTIQDIANDGIKSGNPDSIIWLQFTGLKDKNGKEIYEGDIVNVKLPDAPKWIGEKIKGKIEYDEVGCRFLINQYFDDEFNYDYYQIHEDLKIEVIGNIYENPELC